MGNTPDVPVTEEYLKLLPIRVVTTSGVQCAVRYDQEAGKIYLLDKDGNWTGKVGNYRFDEPQAEQIDLGRETPQDSIPPEESIRQPDMEDPADDNKETEGEDPDGEEAGDDYEVEGQSEGKRKNNKLLIAVAALVVVAAIVYCLSDLIWPKEKNEPTSEPTTVSTEEATENTKATATAADPNEGTEGTDPSEETTEATDAEDQVDVLITATSLLPGDKLTAESFSVISLGEAEYRQVCATMNVFTDSDIERLVGMECTKYTPAGQYIQYDDVATKFAVTNPWGRDSDRQTVLTLPVTCTTDNMGSLLWGRYVDVEITVETTVSVPQTPPAATDPSGEAATEPPAETIPGVQHYTATVESTVVETYKVEAAAIVDVLDVEGNSLFMDFCVLGSIPDAFRAEEVARRYPTLDAVKADIPRYICIAVPTEQAAVLDSLDAERMKVAVSNPTPWVDSELQSELYQTLNSVCSVYVKVWDSVQKEASQG